MLKINPEQAIENHGKNPEHNEQPVYSVLNHGNLEVNGELESAETLRTRYVDLTRKLIHKICGGGDASDRYDTVIFLDKSARPLSWLVKELWNEFAFEEEFFYEEDSHANTPENLAILRENFKPEIKFLNIDKGTWVDEAKDIPFNKNLQQTAWNGKHSANHIAITSLRAVFSSSSSTENEEGHLNSKEVLNSPTILDGKRVLVVDEVQSTGTTQALAGELLRSAIGVASQDNNETGATAIDTACWMVSGLRQGPGGSSNYESPIWYRHDTGSKNEGQGKGIGARNVGKSLASPSSKQRAGALWLSTRLENYDSSLLLRKDIQLLAKQVRNNEINLPQGSFIQWYPPNKSEFLRQSTAHQG